MSAQEPELSKYGFSKTVDLPYAEAVEKTRAALQQEGFGVLCEIDIKEKLKEKLGVDFRNYVISALAILRWLTKPYCRRSISAYCYRAM